MLIILIFTNSVYSNDFTLNDLVSLNSPWGLSFINENKIIITEKDGNIKLFNIIENKIFLLSFLQRYECRYILIFAEYVWLRVLHVKK